MTAKSLTTVIKIFRSKDILKLNKFTDFGPMNMTTRLSQHSSKMISMCGNAKMKNEKKFMSVSPP